jgi:hypothetical protein
MFIRINGYAGEQYGVVKAGVESKVSWATAKSSHEDPPGY